MITRIEIVMHPDAHYRVNVTKQFAQEHGGGEQTFQHPDAVRNPHTALDLARNMVTVSPCSPDYLPADWRNAKRIDGTVALLKAMQEPELFQLLENVLTPEQREELGESWFNIDRQL